MSNSERGDLAEKRLRMKRPIGGGVLRARGSRLIMAKKDGPLNCSELRVLTSQSVLG